MERLRAAEIAQARRTPPAEKFRQALDMMAWGINIQRANLRRRHPGESDAEIDARLQRWLRRVDD
jgi:Rv0078B-related antitoxin